MSDRITYVTAQKILGVAKSTLKGLAAERDWDIVYEKTDGCKRRMLLLSDVEALAVEKGQAERDGANRVVSITPKRMPHKEIVRPNKADETSAHVEWADGLTEWPTDEEIDARVSDVYRRKDLEGIIDTRVFRFYDPKKALRQPAMRVTTRRGKGYL